ncbi:alpha-1,2-fucosyltransferase [Solitalea longa]|uniref:alpha-1,2-fucosyltransferase n=1 Tax=Solitalea longa TaxID=2079460 RepID=UPI0013FE1C2B|nr:alpha-1,2-fucosyltransferase [Solitalea longa]
MKFLGGLGNQMFQYAFYKSLSECYSNVKADLSDFHSYDLHYGFELDKVFYIQLKKASNFESKLLDKHGSNNNWYYRKLRRISGLKKAYYHEKTEFNFDPQIYSEGDKSVRYFWGYWQCEKYFETIKDSLVSDFTFTKPLDDENKAILQEIESCNSVSIHIRRGDYVNHPLLGNITTLEYYQTAISIIKTTIENPVFFVFSNDIEWCKETLKEDGFKFINNNTNAQSYVDMQLMSRCKHNIIANSSFSWWAAWLNQNPNKIIISPKKWTNNPEYTYHGLILDSWIKI